jgi:hypothetical protein
MTRVGENVKGTKNCGLGRAGWERGKFLSLHEIEDDKLGIFWLVSQMV